MICAMLVTYTRFSSLQLQLLTCSDVQTLFSYGPRASKKYSTPFSERGQFLVDFKYAPFAQTTRRSKRMGAGGNVYELEEKEMQQQLTEALAVSIHLEAFPKAVLEAYVQVLQDEGGVLASALTCISLALADAGVMLYDMVSACEAVSCSSSAALIYCRQVGISAHVSSSRHR